MNSTLASFWFLIPVSEERIRQTLAQVGGGRILDAADLEHYHLRFRDNRYGDLLFLADPETEIVPNWMSLTRRASRGMHGYAPENPETAAFIAGPRTKIADLRDVVDVFSLLTANVEGIDSLLTAVGDA